MKPVPAMPLKQRQSLSDELARILTRQIEDGEYPPGQTLPSEQDIAGAFSVSRTVVREALARLRHQGLIRSRKGSGSVVCESMESGGFTLQLEELSRADLARFIEFRLVIEGEGVALAAVRRNPEQLRKLAECIGQMEEAVAKGLSGTKPDYEFHCTLAAASGNEYLEDFFKFLSSKLWLGVDRSRRLSNRDEPMAKGVLREHKDIYEAIRDQDVFRARLALRTNLVNSARRQGVELTEIGIPWSPLVAAQARDAGNEVKRPAVAGRRPTVRRRTPAGHWNPGTYRGGAS